MLASEHTEGGGLWILAPVPHILNVLRTDFLMADVNRKND